METHTVPLSEKRIPIHSFQSVSRNAHNTEFQNWIHTCCQVVKPFNCLPIPSYVVLRIHSPFNSSSTGHSQFQIFLLYGILMFNLLSSIYWTITMCVKHWGSKVNVIHLFFRSTQSDRGRRNCEQMTA